MFNEELKQGRRRRLLTLPRLFHCRSIRQMLSNFLGVELYGLYQSSGKEKESYSVFPFSTKRDIRHFHVVRALVQRRLRNVQKSVMHVQSCCFANLNLLLFCCCRCRRRRRCLNFLITIFIYLFAGASYTANLASFLITDVFDTPIDSLEDLASQTKIKYGCIKDSHIMTFFQMSHVPVHAKMWAFMQRHDTLVKNMTEGIQRAKEGGYAFIGESEMLEYYTKQKPCDTLTTIGR